MAVVSVHAEEIDEPFGMFRFVFPLPVEGQYGSDARGLEELALPVFGVVTPDIDIIGFNASLFTNLANPKMTSVNNKIEETSVRSAKMLLDIIDGKEVHDEILPCSLVIKESA